MSTTSLRLTHPCAARHSTAWLTGPTITDLGEGDSRRDPATGARFKGSATETVQAPINRHVYFFRCGKTPFVVPRA